MSRGIFIFGSYPQKPAFSHYWAQLAIIYLTQDTMRSDNTNIWNNWDPKLYLNEFYSGAVAPDELETINFLSRLAKNLPQQYKILDFGCGPTIHHILPFLKNASEVHLADLFQSNLDQISKYLKKDKIAHNWDQYIKYALECEGVQKPSENEIAARRGSIYEKITKLVVADAGDVNPLGEASREQYEVVISCYCADSATSDYETFSQYIKNISSLVKPGGVLVLACLRKALHYRAGASYFPSANVDEVLVYQLLCLDFKLETITIETKELPHHAHQGYSGIILAHATKK